MQKNKLPSVETCKTLFVYYQLEFHVQFKSVGTIPSNCRLIHVIKPLEKGSSYVTVFDIITSYVTVHNPSRDNTCAPVWTQEGHLSKGPLEFLKKKKL